MDLTNLQHSLTIGGTTTQIEEPVDFDNLKLTLKRSSYHGISAEVSDTSLGFYGTAATLIRTAYDTDIETVINYTVMSGNTTIYTAQLDLSTVEITEAPYYLVKCKAGEIGIKTTFNNRTDTEIDLNTTKTIEDVNLAHTYNWKKIKLPPKTIIYTNKQLTKDVAKVWNKDTVPTGRFNLGLDWSHHWLNLALADSAQVEEFGSFTGQPDLATDIDTHSITDITNYDIEDYYEPLYQEQEDMEEKFGTGSQYIVTGSITATLTALTDLYSSYSPTGSIKRMDARLVLFADNCKFGDAGAGTPLAYGSKVSISDTVTEAQLSLTINTQAISATRLYLGIILENRFQGNTYAYMNLEAEMQVTIAAGSYITMKLQSQRGGSVTTDALMVHEVLNKTVEVLSNNQLTVKSDLYSRSDSPVNPKASPGVPGMVSLGAQALKCITNGYKIRGLYSSSEDDEAERAMSVSFKDVIEALNAQDCIGWGFVNESGTLYIRVEPWDWFYKSDVVLELDEPAESTRTVATDRIVTTFICGYKKYVDNDDINASDTIHGDRTWCNGGKVLNKQLSKLCSWIADTYAIEVTRRKALESNDTSDFKYDENIFVIELKHTSTGINAGYSVATNSITNASGFLQPSEQYNVRISPNRMARKWLGYLAMDNSTRDYKFTTGKMNTAASYQENANSASVKYLQSYTGSAYHTEEDAQLNNIATTVAKEIVTCTYPLTSTQYDTLKASPYGLIKMGSNYYWLSEVSYELKSGKAELKLIPKIN